MVRRALGIAGIIVMFALEPALAATGSLGLQAVVLSKSRCRFATTTGTVPFGTLDPSAPTTVTQNLSLTIRCGGSEPLATFLISDDDGLYETGLDGNRLQHATIPTAFIPYTLSYTPTSSTIPRNTDQIIVVTAGIDASAYATQPAGNYADTVILSISP